MVFWSLINLLFALDFTSFGGWRDKILVVFGWCSEGLVSTRFDSFDPVSIFLVAVVRSFGWVLCI